MTFQYIGNGKSSQVTFTPSFQRGRAKNHQPAMGRFTVDAFRGRTGSSVVKKTTPKAFSQRISNLILFQLRRKCCSNTFLFEIYPLRFDHIFLRLLDQCEHIEESILVQVY